MKSIEIAEKFENREFKNKVVTLVHSDNTREELCTVCKNTISINTNILIDFNTHIDKFIILLTDNISPEYLMGTENFKNILYDIYHIREFLYEKRTKYLRDNKVSILVGSFAEVSLICDCLILYYVFAYDYDFNTEDVDNWAEIEFILKERMGDEGDE